MMVLSMHLSSNRSEVRTRTFIKVCANHGEHGNFLGRKFIVDYEILKSLCFYCYYYHIIIIIIIISSNNTVSKKSQLSSKLNSD